MGERRINMNLSDLTDAQLIKLQIVNHNELMASMATFREISECIEEEKKRRERSRERSNQPPAICL